jgi:hypothetical protein
MLHCSLLLCTVKDIYMNCLICVSKSHCNRALHQKNKRKKQIWLQCCQIQYCTRQKAQHLGNLNCIVIWFKLTYIIALSGKFISKLFLKHCINILSILCEFFICMWDSNIMSTVFFHIIPEFHSVFTIHCDLHYCSAYCKIYSKPQLHTSARGMWWLTELIKGILLIFIHQLDEG